MRNMVKSSVDGNWYYEYTDWRLVLDCLCDALSMFSEEDKVHPYYIIINNVTDRVFELINKSKEK